MRRRTLLAGLAGLAVFQASAFAEGGSASRPFMMMDVNGIVVNDDNLRGRFSLLFFGYTHCPDVCPTSLYTMANVLKEMGKEADKLLPLFITLDPERDTPKLLSQYIQNFDDRIVPLRGPKPYTDAMAKIFDIKYQVRPTSDPAVYTIDHTASITLVGPDGAVIKRYAHGMEATAIAADLKAIMAKAPATP